MRSIYWRRRGKRVRASCRMIPILSFSVSVRTALISRVSCGPQSPNALAQDVPGGRDQSYGDARAVLSSYREMKPSRARSVSSLACDSLSHAVRLNLTTTVLDCRYCRP